MNTPLLNKLREHLASISKEEFRKEWAEVKAMGLEGPTMDEFIHSISLNVTVAEINVAESINSNVDLVQIVVSKGENNYALAA